MNDRRAPRGWTYDPCPGCRQTEDARKRDSVCSTCAGILSNARIAADERAERAKAGGDAPALYRIPSRYHWLPYLSEKGVTERPIQQAFHAALLAASEHSDEERYNVREPLLIRPGPSDDRHSADTRRLFARKSLAVALSNLFDAVREGLAAAYKDGVDDGSNLLRRLRDGSMSPDDFERRRGTG